MNIFKKGLIIGLASLGLSMSAQASNINVGGVIWDPQQNLAFPGLGDFVANGTIFENNAENPGDIVMGRGEVTNLNSAVPNQAQFCPGCELTFTFSMELVGFVGVPNPGSAGGTNGQFTFTNFNLKFYVDHTPEFDGTMATAADGNLWLELVLNPANFLTGTGTALGSGSESGTGGGVLDVIGGLAFGNFNTNGEANGGDLTLSSSFQPTLGAPGLLNGTFDLSGDTIPEPGSIALIALGLLGFASSRRKS